MIEIKCIDNLKYMAEINDNTIDLIYCDILYGTGRKFKDYQDLKPIRSEIESHYIPRIKEMHRILKPTGSIYLQMDYRISHWLRIIMDDIFGYDRYLQTVYWKYDAGGKHKTKFKTVVDEIIIYTKTENYTLNLDKVMIPHHPDTYKRIKGYANAGITININGKQRENLWFINAVKKGNYTKQNNEWVDYVTQKPKELEEIWKDIEGWEKFYKISNLGNVKSLKRIIVDCNGRKISLKERILKLGKNPKGYSFCILCNGNITKTICIHRMVAKYFIPNINNKLEINHLNGIKSDNKLTNLEWVTRSENMLYSFNILGLKSNNKGKTGILCKNSKPVSQFTKNNILINEFVSISEASIITGINRSCIEFVCTNRRNYKTAGGYIWKFTYPQF